MQPQSNPAYFHARLAGVLYLIIIVCAGFAEGGVRASLIVPGDAALTAEHILGSEFLYRLGFSLDLVAFLCDLGVSILFYVLLKPVNRTLALTAAMLRLLAHPAIASVNLINHYGALQILTNESLNAAFSAEQLQSIALLFTEFHTTGYLIAGAFFGMHCLLLGYLLVKSDLFPSLIGVFIGIAAVAYLLNSFGNFLMPEHRTFFDAIVVVPAVIAELSLGLWLLFKGVYNRRSVQVMSG
ncbi:DUF4386 domain-containing protein [Saccharospirillum salsuginis]|uniref:DUF4386 domain-containing protein n=1 Tax=Saccharospirillum salsuginis TaxID=418750 RepID=A0A918KRU6_9GAMM|nr:DUF4386 domain-containing protein [Saccharospirillum salsuginis]GGX73533.1 DUF4386 domain-containing protein [Saccharospirillum salsuginis]